MQMAPCFSSCFSRNQGSLDLRLFNFDESLGIVASVATASVLFCCFSSSASWLDMPCVFMPVNPFEPLQVILGYTIKLNRIDVLLPWLQWVVTGVTVALQSARSQAIFPSDLWHQGIFTQRTATHSIFSLFQAILCWPMWGNPRTSSVSETPASWHQHPCLIQSHLNPLLSPFWRSL